MNVPLLRAARASLRSRHYTGAEIALGIALASTLFVIFMVALTGFTSLLTFLVVAVILLVEASSR